MSMIYRINAGVIPGDSWIQDMETGGGRIIGEGCHFIDYLTWMNGSLPVKVFASALPLSVDLSSTGSTSCWPMRADARAVVDTNVLINAALLAGRADMLISGDGDDLTPNRKFASRLNTGLTVIGKRAAIPDGLRIAANTIVEPHAGESSFASITLGVGSYVKR